MKAGTPIPAAMLAAMLCAALLASGCGGLDEDFEYNYTVTSPTLMLFPVGVQVAVVRANDSGNCAGPVLSTATRVGAGTVTTPDIVSFSFRDDRIGTFYESMYVDAEPSGNVSALDLVWGLVPTAIEFLCSSSDLPKTISLNWEFLALTAGGFVPYTGVTQPY